MATLPTVEIIKPGTDRRIVINEADYDAEQHTLWGAEELAEEEPAEDLSSLTKAELEERAAELGIDLDEIEGTGKNGYVKASDIAAAIEAYQE